MTSGSIGATPLLAGRDGAIARLRPALDRLAAGQGALVLIAGEAGVGKTTLAEVGLAGARVSGAITATGRCYEQGVAPPFAPWTDLLATLATSDALAVASLPPPFGAGTAAQTTYQLLQAVVAGLRAAAVTRPLALLLDDLQWAEQEALDLLDLLTRQLDDTALLVLATYRPEDARPGQPLHRLLGPLQRNRRVLSLALDPLTAPDIGWLAEARLGPCSADLTAYLLARTEGNPLFLMTLLEELAGQQRLPRGDDGRWQAPVDTLSPPALLRVVTEQRVARLGGEAVALLDVAAVAGMEWDLATVETVLGWLEEPLLRALDDIVATGVIEPAPSAAERYRFHHSLVRDVLYERQLARRRRHLHQRIGRALEATLAASQSSAEVVAALTYHAAAAEDWPRLARYALAAGDIARDRMASHTAALRYGQALDAAERIPAADRPIAPAQAAERLGHALLLLTQHQAANAAFGRMAGAARDAGDADAETRALCWQSWIARRAYRLPAARALATTALTRAQAAGSSSLLAHAHWNLGHLEKLAGDPPAAMRHLTEAERAARADGATDVLGWCLQSLAQIAIWRGDYLLAEAQATEALTLARAGHDALTVGGAAWVLGIALGERGHYGAALRRLHDGLAQAGESGERHYQARLLNTVGWLHAEIGDFAIAREWDERSLASARHDAGDTVTEAERYALLNLTIDALGLGDVAAAETHAATFARLLDDSEYARLRYLNRFQLVQGELALARGDGTAAVRAAEEAARLAQSTGVRKNLARGWLLAGQALLALDRPREAAERLRRAVALADELTHGALRWQARHWLGQAETAQHRPREAAVARVAALAHVDAVAAVLPTAEMQAAFAAWAPVQAVRAAGGASPPPAADYPAGLSAREVEVLRLVAQGETNQAIADALSISIKTVNTHMTSIFNKTGSANRAAATSFALRHGLA
ncbi:MAG: AAA family ATPase [Chloroflexi bacterium]|nr:AAA family ATPase [Chloroflexota bacterium]